MDKDMLLTGDVSRPGGVEREAARLMRELRVIDAAFSWFVRSGEFVGWSSAETRVESAYYAGFGNTKASGVKSLACFHAHVVRMVMRGPMSYQRGSRPAVVFNWYPDYCVGPGMYGPRVYELARLFGNISTVDIPKRAEDADRYFARVARGEVNDGSEA